MNKKFVVAQICAVLLVGGVLGGMFVFTDVYDEVENRIVLVLCLSCLKLEPRIEAAFTFTTVDSAPHPDFVLDNLSKGIIFLHYSEDVCAGCDVMYPVIQDLFDITFTKDEMFFKTVVFNGFNVTHIYINIDHTTSEQRDSRIIYDKDNVGGLPMFTIVTLGYDHGIVKPYYTSLYGTLKETDQERLLYLTDLLNQSNEVYEQNMKGYEHPH